MEDSMARLPYVDPATASPQVQETFARLPVPLRVFQMMAHAETAFRPLIALGTAILGAQELSPMLRELVILRVAALSPSRYEWGQHVPIALAVGATADQVAAVERGDVEAACFDARTRLGLRFATEVLRDVRASDATFADAKAAFSPREIVELILTVGYYMTVARILETTAVDLDEPAGTLVTDRLR
jgi:alkylhydroperoxidase family enzyme